MHFAIPLGHIFFILPEYFYVPAAKCFVRVMGLDLVT